MSHTHEFDDARLRALLRATDGAASLTGEREAALAARIVAQGAPWLALRADGVATRPNDGVLDALAERIAVRAWPTLAAYRRPVRRSAWMDVAVRWSRPALPLAIAAGIGAMMVLMRTPAPADADGTDTNSTIAAMNGSNTVTLASMTPEAAIDGGAEGGQ